MHVPIIIYYNVCILNACILVSPEPDKTVSALYPTGGGTRVWAKAIHIHTDFLIIIIYY